MVFDFLEKSARAAVNVVGDTVDFATGGEPPRRDDVAQLLAAGLSVWAVAEVTGLAVDAVQAIADGTD
jgi:DNA-binding NarL/FixJ family response regulator